MNRREKIILGVVAVALGAAAVDWGLRSLSAGPRGHATETPTVDLDALVAQVAVQIEASKPGRVPRRVLEIADREWRPDLFRLAPEGPSLAATLEEAAAARPTPSYTGYLAFGRRPFGILDGTEYAEGEWTLDGHYRIVRLGPTEVELLPRGEDVSITIPLEP